MSHVGLATRDLLELLLMYEGSIGARVFSAGNLEYLELLLEAAKRLGRSLADAPLSALAPRSKVVAMLELIEGQDVSNAQRTAQDVLAHLSELRLAYAAAQRAPDLYARGRLPPLDPDYERIVVYFGAAMGLGDQITFYQVLRHVARHCRRAHVIIYTLYPGLWPDLLEGAEERSYREDPLRPFLDLNAPPDGPPPRELIVSADFEVFDLHRHVIAKRRRRDILELALGRMTAWLAADGSPFVHVDELRAGHDSNYAFAHALARRLVPGLTGWAMWDPIAPDSAVDDGPRSWLRVLQERWRARSERGLARRPRSAAEADRPTRQVVFVNPFTSKHLPFGAGGWAHGIQRLHAGARRSAPFEVVLYPGLEPRTHAFAEEIRARLSHGPDPVPVRLLAPPDGPLTPLNALPTLVQAARGFDLCVTVDTFSAHLLPLFRVPTVVLAYPQFKRFWVPSRWSYNCLIEDMETSGLALVARVLELLSGRGPDPRRWRRAAARLLRATREAHLNGLGPAGVAGLEAALAHAFLLLDRGFPSYEEAQHWLMLFSRLAWATQRRPLPEASLRGYLELWEESQIFKLLTLVV